MPSEEDGITSVDDDGVPTFDESHEDFHTYYLENSCSKATSGCSLERVRGGLLRHPAPGATGSSVSDEQTGNAIIGLVRHEVSADGGTVLNITLPSGQNQFFPKHLLDPGIVLLGSLTLR